jgi:DNA-binding transcriptional ArsR family regulator
MATDRLSTIFAALADPTRREILARLADGEATVTELAAPFDISLPAISRHLKVLEQAGLISRSRSAQWRSSRLEAAPLQEATAWMETYRQFWDASFDRLDAHLKRLQQAPQGQSRPVQEKGRPAQAEAGSTRSRPVRRQPPAKGTAR